MSPELAQSLAAIRLRQTAELLTWMTDTFADPGPLSGARDLVTEALHIVERHRGSGLIV